MKNSEQYHLILRWTIKLQRTWHILIYIYMNDRFTNNNTFYFDIDFRYLRAILLHFMNRMRKPSLKFFSNFRSRSEYCNTIVFISQSTKLISWMNWIRKKELNGITSRIISTKDYYFTWKNVANFFLISLNLQACYINHFYMYSRIIFLKLGRKLQQ